MDIFLPASGLWLMFALGLRHGFDPDHIAMIDSMAYRSLSRRAAHAPWIGTLFALGHGLAVTAIAFLIGVFAAGIELPATLRVLLDWMPAALLILVGTLNLRDLLGQHAFEIRGWKTRLIPRRLRGSSHPLAIFFIGILFALVFDTATQAAAWGYAATASAGSAMALLAGLAFTAGMVLTDTIDGRLMVYLLRHASRGNRATTYRRWVGWSVVLMSYAMAAYAIAVHLRPGAELGDLALTAIGASLFLALVFAYRIERKRPLAASPLTQDPA